MGSVDSVITNAKIGLRKMKIQFPDKLIIAHLNINSIRNKFDSLSFMVENNADILLISDTKLDDSFPSSQFKICGFSMPYRYDRNSMGGGLLLYIRHDIPTKLLKHDFGTNIENLSVETNLRKRKWFFNGSDNPNKSKILNHLNYLNLVFNKYSKVYDNFIFMGDVIVAMSDKAMEDFYSLNNLESLISKPTCYKNHENPTCIDLILTNRPGYFQHSNAFETGISDFHLLTVTQLKMDFQKKLTKIITYRDYKKFDNAKFRDNVNNFAFDQFDVSNFKETKYLTYLINMLQSNKNIFEQMKPLL